MTDRESTEKAGVGGDLRREAAGREAARRMTWLIVGMCCPALIGAACLFLGAVAGPTRPAGMGLIAAGVAIEAVVVVLGGTRARRIKARWIAERGEQQ